MNAELMISSVLQHESAEKAEHSEESLRISEEQFRLAILDAPIPVIMHAEDGEVLTVSRSWTELTGYSKEDASVIQTWLTEAYGYGGEQVRDMMRRSFLPPMDGEKALHETTFVITTCSGEKRTWWFHASAPGLLADGRRFVVGMAADITDRNRAEAALRESERLLEQQALIFDTTLSSITDFAYTFDKEGRFIYANRPLLDLLDISLEEIVGKNFFDLNYPDALAERLQNQIQHVLDTKATVRDETPFTGPTGAGGFYEYIFSAVVGTDGSVERVAGSTRDITDQKKLEEKLRFLSNLDHTVQQISEPDEVMLRTAEMLANHIGADRCAYAEIEDESIFVITGDYTRAVPSIVGRWPVAAFGSECARQMHANEAYVVNDTDTDPRIRPDDLPAYRATNIRSVICVPLHKDGKFTAAMAVHQKQPREWTASETELVQMTVSRCWESIERTRAARDIRESERLLEALAESVLDGILIVAPGGHMLHHNQRFLDMWNFPAEIIELKSDPAALAWAAQQTTDPAAFLGRVDHIYNHPDIQFREEMWMKDGRVYERFGAPVQHGETRLGWVWTFRDITESKKAEMALRESEERFRSMADNAPVMIWVTEPDGNSTYLSESWYKFTGQTPETGLGMGWLDATHPDDAAEAERIFLAANETHEAFRVEYRLRRVDGEYRWAIDSAQPRFSESGEFLGYIGSVIDITERKRSEVELRAHAEELERFNRLMAGRELRMIDLKKEVNALRQARGENPPYPLEFESNGGGDKS